jgi:hypothetical protein
LIIVKPREIEKRKQKRTGSLKSLIADENLVRRNSTRKEANRGNKEKELIWRSQVSHLGLNAVQ